MRERKRQFKISARRLDFLDYGNPYVTHAQAAYNHGAQDTYQDVLDFKDDYPFEEQE